jgi:hypothetical protein
MLNAYVIGVCRSLEELWILIERVPFVDVLERVGLGVQIARVEVKPIPSPLLLELSDLKVSR